VANRVRVGIQSFERGNHPIENKSNRPEHEADAGLDGSKAR
jgi:hypothetical protein